MRIENHSVEDYTQQGYQLEDIYKQIERCGRVCYKSEDKITDDSYKAFVERLKASKHNSVLEHGNVYLKLDSIFVHPFKCIKYWINKFSRISCDWRGSVYISTNMRVIVENKWEGDLRYICEPTKKHIKRICFKVRTSIGVSREFNRHRVFSISEQSTRYCNYSKDKFGGKVAFIEPTWLNGRAGISPEYKIWLRTLHNTNYVYKRLTKQGYKAQEARGSLPLDTATTVIYTAFEDDWENVLALRSSKAGATGQHPDADIVGNMIYDLLHKQ